MSDMVERVAAAIYEEPNAALRISSPWADASQLTQAVFRSKARAAIAAMRGPEEWMVAGFPDPEQAAGIWNNMLNKALDGKP